MPVAVAGGKNVVAFLDMLAWSEIGPELLSKSDDGYNVLVGSTPQKPLLFDSYGAHPDAYDPKTNSTAAGRYQFLSRYWPHYRDLLRLPDFGPVSQDRYAIQLMQERKALQPIIAGNIQAAIALVSNIWASLPGAGYQQREHSLADLLAAYKNAGGSIARAA
nr:glycoside hydrolase family 104 protein [Dyella japonica]